MQCLPSCLTHTYCTSDMDRWRLAEHSLWSWKCVVCWAERKVALRPSLIPTCYVCSLLWSSCTLGSRYTACIFDNLSSCCSDTNPEIFSNLAPVFTYFWCVNNSEFWTWTCSLPQLAASQAKVQSFFLETQVLFRARLK